MLKLILFLNIVISFLNASIEKYSISVCTTSSLENALTCKKRIIKNNNNEVFIVKEINGKFTTYLGIFENASNANQMIKVSSNYVKEQKPFSKKLQNEIINYNFENKIYIDLNNSSINSKTDSDSLKESTTLNNKIEEKSIQNANEYKSTDNTYSQEEIKYLEELIEISLKEFEKSKEINLSEQKDEKVKIKENLIFNITNYEQILIEVDSISNSMIVKAKINNEFKNIRIYTVSTGKKDIKKPLGEGKISLITINPTWYPTTDTLVSFRKKGIYLPNMVPPGHKFNYMGAAKINLTHIVDGKNTFRIHGTLNENTIGTNESSGCIRMRNNEVLQLASLLNEFAVLKSLDNIKVVLK